ncbi:hypothetical protein ET495_00035 [Xylanimonas allomyrinae]|uniref:DUF7507 domain-containing protein n=1 Tax=Xylanimonas allomyrinae TaxID=2509459 RepID=A0A4P6EHS0_9MICO|nr:hypothetical protein [Xylanimonas allomyrinae]QAY61954.1 hypothetical protein ET495_00035 [Xylanimonas allomyrinae]
MSIREGGAGERCEIPWRRAAAIVTVGVLALTGATALAASSAAGAPATGVPAAVPSGQPLVPIDTTCSFAEPGTGLHADTICWIDLAEVSPERTFEAHTIHVSLPDGSVVSLLLQVQGASAGPVPVGDGYLGGRGYLGIAGDVAVIGGHPTYIQTGLSVAAAQAVGPTGDLVAPPPIVFADAGSILSTAGGSVKLVNVRPLQGDQGDACPGGPHESLDPPLGLDQDVYVCTAAESGPRPGAVMGIGVPGTRPMAIIESADSLGALSGAAVAIGVKLSAVQVTTRIVSPDAGDVAEASVRSEAGTTLTSAETTPSETSAASPVIRFLPSAAGDDVTFATQVPNGSPGLYLQQWECSPDAGQMSATTPIAANVAHAVNVQPGTLVSCTVTHLAQRLAIQTTATTIDVNADGAVSAGDTVQFRYTVRNTGAVRFTGILVEDAIAGSVTCDDAALEPGASTTCTAVRPYVVSAADAAAGEVTSTATAGGASPDGDAPVRSTPAVVTVALDEPGRVTESPSEPPASPSPTPEASAGTEAGQPTADSSDSGILPRTGMSPLGALAALVLVAGGVFLVVIARRRLVAGARR